MRPVLATKIEPDEIERQGVNVIVDLLREGVRKPREPAHGPAHREIVAFDVGRADMRFIGIAALGLLASADAFSETVTALWRA